MWTNSLLVGLVIITSLMVGWATSVWHRYYALKAQVAILSARLDSEANAISELVGMVTDLAIELKRTVEVMLKMSQKPVDTTTKIS